MARPLNVKRMPIRSATRRPPGYGRSHAAPRISSIKQILRNRKSHYVIITSWGSFFFLPFVSRPTMYGGKWLLDSCFPFRLNPRRKEEARKSIFISMKVPFGRRKFGFFGCVAAKRLRIKIPAQEEQQRGLWACKLSRDSLERIEDIIERSSMRLHKALWRETP